MLKMSGFDVVLATAGNLYLLLALAAICFALWMGKTWIRKLAFSLLVLALFIAPIAPDIYRTIEYRAKLAKAQALFDERCKTAGEKIYRTVENVEGIQLLKVREYVGSGEGQYVASAAAAHESTGDFYIRSFLLYEREDGKFAGRALVKDLNTSKLPGRALWM